MVQEITLEELQKDYGEKWNIYQTPKGVFVAQRHRHFMLTPSRVDQGFRACLIEPTGRKMKAEIVKQEELSKSLTTNGA